MHCANLHIRCEDYKLAPVIPFQGDNIKLVLLLLGVSIEFVLKHTHTLLFYTQDFLSPGRRVLFTVGWLNIIRDFFFLFSALR
ncbi:hypothetical protein BC828DRAFT_249984 [Blastocladiella britannica]|nr:hypothetical protein BC828DRAFT_249984 [Blastocladiella britannica]